MIKKLKVPIILGTVIVSLLATTIISNAAFTNPTSTNSDYDRDEAYSYMTDYTEDYNEDEYPYYSSDGDCTNFASQVLRAGGMDFTSRSTCPTTNHWYYYYDSWGWGRTGTWTKAHQFRQHWGDVNNQGLKRAYKMTNYTVSSALSNLSTIRSAVKKGDIIQHTKYVGGETYHSQIVYSKPIGDITIANHSGIDGDAFESFEDFLQNRINLGRSTDYVSVIQIKYGN